MLTGVVHVATFWLELYIGRWRWLDRITVTIVSLMIVVFVGLGVWKATELPGVVVKVFGLVSSN